MPDNDMTEMMKALIEQNKAMMENQSEKNGTPGPSNLAKRPAETKQQSSKIKVTKFKMVPISRLPVLATLSGSRPNEETCTESDISRLPVLAALIRSRPDEGTCTESDNANVTSDA